MTTKDIFERLHADTERFMNAAIDAGPAQIVDEADKVLLELINTRTRIALNAVLMAVAKELARSSSESDVP